MRRLNGSFSSLRSRGWRSRRYVSGRFFLRSRGGVRHWCRNDRCFRFNRCLDNRFSLLLGLAGATGLLRLFGLFNLRRFSLDSGRRLYAFGCIRYVAIVNAVIGIALITVAIFGVQQVAISSRLRRPPRLPRRRRLRLPSS